MGKCECIDALDDQSFAFAGLCFSFLLQLFALAVCFAFRLTFYFRLQKSRKTLDNTATYAYTSNTECLQSLA